MCEKSVVSKICRLTVGNFTNKWAPSQAFFNTVLSSSCSLHSSLPPSNFEELPRNPPPPIPQCSAALPHVLNTCGKHCRRSYFFLFQRKSYILFLLYFGIVQIWPMYHGLDERVWNTIIFLPLKESLTLFQIWIELNASLCSFKINCILLR